MSDDTNLDFLALTTGIVCAHVSHNSVHAADLPKMISAVHEALAGLGAPVQSEPSQPEHKPAVTVRKSLANDEHILSMIDGKPYKSLRRHLSAHGLTDEEYRTRYNLAPDYPLVAKAYSAARSAMARTFGLGRKVRQGATEAAATVQAEVAEVAAPIADTVKRGARKAVAKVEDAATPARKRGRKATA